MYKRQEQGAQQLSIYNDYNNQDHGNGSGNIVQAIVFRERPVEAADLGTTLTLTFDAKAGNINDPADAACQGNVCDSTAEAFVVVLDSLGGSFAPLGEAIEVTTSLPDTWGTFSISVAIDPTWAGQLLQFGFRSKAQNGEPSGIFYDNATFGPTGCSGDGGGGPGPGPGGELTTNGDFETGDFTGWTNFCDTPGQSCTITQDNPNGGQYAASVLNNAPATPAVIKQERIAAGEVATGDTVDVSVFLRGSVGAGGLVFVEVFSEETGGNVVQEAILGPFFPTNDWVEVSASVLLNGNPGDGITLQVAAITGGDPASFADVFVDDASVVKQ